MPRASTHYSIYLDALATFDEPATAKQIYNRAIEKFGADRVTGGTESIRTSLRRYIKMGKAISPERGKYAVTMAAIDPIMALDAERQRLRINNKALSEQVGALEAECERLRQRVKELEATA